MTRALLPLAAAICLLAAGCADIPDAGSASIQPLLSRSSLDQKVAAGGEPVAVFYYKPGCPHCHAAYPTQQKLSEEYAGRVDFYQANIPARPELLPYEDRITMAPTVILWVNGREFRRIEGHKSEQVYRAALEEAMASEGA